MSVQREYSLPAPTIAEVSLTGGNGRDPSGNIAKAFLDMRTSSIFSLDISGLTVASNGPVNDFVYIQFDTFTGAPGALPGKEIVLLFTGTPNSYGVYASFTSNFGQNISQCGNDNIFTYTNMYMYR